ncbi:MAG: CHASE3 domain-containing protein [Mucilaginibacter sp.]|nr:CHASE3 domain-containing protein [Mucilaginibacter sp.]
MINNFDRNLRLGYGFSIIVLITVSLVSWLTLNSLINSNSAVVHSSEVMQKLEQLLSTMKDAETGQRGYLLTGQAKYLEPFNGSDKQAGYLAVEIRELTADNPIQQTNLKAIEVYSAKGLTFFSNLSQKNEIVPQSCLLTWKQEKQQWMLCGMRYARPKKMSGFC